MSGRQALTKALSWGVPAVALLMLLLTLTPAEVWNHPVNDAVYRGFDPNLIYSTNGGEGSVKVLPDSIDMTAGPSAEPSANLATTLMPNLNASMDVVILANKGASEALRIGAWSPWSLSGHFVVFGPDPMNQITAETIASGDAGPTLSGGSVLDSQVLGHYKIGSSYAVSIAVDRSGGTITSTVSGPNGVIGEASMTRQAYPEIFRNVQFSISASALGGDGTSHAAITNYVLTVPHQRWWAVIVADPKERALLISLAVAGLVLLGLSVARRYRALSNLPTRARSSLLALRGINARLLVAVLIAILIYVAGNAFLIPLGGHPFDMAYEKLYPYVAHTRGPADLYTLLNVGSLAGIWAGTPYLETSFPYGGVMAYIFAGVGWLNSFLFAGGGAFRPDSVSVEYMIKAVNVLFGLLDAVLIYEILRQIKVSTRWSLIASGLFLFNPAVWFSMSIWGQTHVISIFFVLLAVFLAEKHLPAWAWLALVAAFLTRPQMLVFGLVVGLVFLRKFTWRENLRAMSWTVILTFLALLPLTLATSPSLPIDVTLNNLRIQEAGGNGSALSPVSQGGYSIWPLATYLTHGLSGLGRTFTASSDVLVGGLTYQLAAQILTISAMILLSAIVLRRPKVAFESGGYLPLVALGITSFLMFITGVVATHFLLALPFLLLCRKWMNNVAYIYVTAIWTITTFVPMYGEMGAFLTPQAYPLLSPSTNLLTAFFVALYSWDRFITLAVVANLCALAWLGWLTLRKPIPSTGFTSLESR